MNILYYDCFAGISGDMNLGTLIDLGVPSGYLTKELNKLKLDGYSIDVSKELKMGIAGTKVTISIPDRHHHAEDNHGHSHGHIHNHETKHEKHPHRSIKDIRKIIESSSLNSLIKEKSLAVFSEIAIAEAKIHSKPIDAIHFHEVGAIDSIVDIVGAAICIDYLKPDRILASTVELGGGFVECAHGIFPVPAPATAEILRNIPIRTGTVDKETTTPTGAAILKVFVDEFTDHLQISIEKTAYGIGHRDLKIPNVLRTYWGKLSETSDLLQSAAIMIECNIDDMNPEHYPYIMDLLFEAGAQDVFMVPIIMKKSRPAVQLSVLCDTSDSEKMVHILLNETTSLGIRYSHVAKSMLERRNHTVKTAFGPVRVKEGIFNGRIIKCKPEYDDCARIAKQAGIPLSDVYAAADISIKKLIQKG
jgi:pyridinium-3,5-bisthiocarboxylic acid mononucleotide nickel chelatase